MGSLLLIAYAFLYLFLNPHVFSNMKHPNNYIIIHIIK